MTQDRIQSFTCRRSKSDPEIFDSGEVYVALTSIDTISRVYYEKRIIVLHADVARMILVFLIFQ